MLYTLPKCNAKLGEIKIRVEILILGLVLLSTVSAGCIESEPLTKTAPQAEEISETTQPTVETIIAPQTTVPSTTQPPTTTLPATAPPTTTLPPTTQPPIPTELNLNVGETAKSSTLEVTVVSTDVDWVVRCDGPPGHYNREFMSYVVGVSKHEYRLLLADVEIENVGANQITAERTDFSMTDSEGYRYEPDLTTDCFDDALGISEELYRNQKVRGKILFERFPKDATGLKILYDFGGLFTGPKLASWSVE